MKIDLHCHTLNTKSGDSPKRATTKRIFIEKLTNSGVSICAITNHNHFDLVQYNDFANNPSIKIFPGIELDVNGHGSNGHCLLISSPERVDEFSRMITTVIAGTHPDDFSIDIDNLLNLIKNTDYILIPHYGSKAEALKQSDIDYLKNNIGTTPFLLEPSNLRSAGIMIAHNMSTIIGSDVKDWDLYHTYKLPELKIPIDGYAQFLKLLKKDISTIETFVKGKFAEEVIINPMEYPDCNIKLDIFNDVNVIFGGKGTGKTELLLKSIEKHFQSKDKNDVSSYFPNDNLADFEKYKSIELKESDLAYITPNDLSNHFKVIKEHTAPSVTPTSEYYKWKTSTNAKKHVFGYEKATFTESWNVIQSNFDIEYDNYKKIGKAIVDIEIVAIKPYLSDEDRQSLKEILGRLKVKSWEITYDLYSKYNASRLIEWSINKLKLLYKSKTGNDSKPLKTGLISVFDSCFNVHDAASRIRAAMELDQKSKRNIIGNLIDKGPIYQEINYSINPKHAKQGTKYLTSGLTQSKLNNLKKRIDDLVSKSFTLDQQKSIVDYKTDCGPYGIDSLAKLLFYNFRPVDEEGELCEPSPGEKAMLLLHSKLMDDTKNVFILDEPESKVGHKYINEIIIPRLLELARLGKKIIVTTHDANIAVRTLPLTSIYRYQYRDDNGVHYKTFVGSPFINDMTCYENKTETINWVKTSMDSLEGGETAFIERGENYGN